MKIRVGKASVEYMDGKIIEFEDDATEAEIEEVIFDMACSNLTFDWSVVGERNKK